MPGKSTRLLISGCIGAFIGLILAGVALLFISKKYECSMEIRRVEVALERFKVPPGVMYFATEMPDGWFLRSRNSFEFVAERLSLSERWGIPEHEVLERLKHGVQVEPKGDRVYRVEVSCSDPDEAFEISKLILDAARSRLTEMYSVAAERHLAHLRGEITDRSNKLVERRRIIAAIPKDLDSADRHLNELEADLLELRGEEEALVAMKRNYETRKRQAANIPDPIEVLKPPFMPKRFYQPRIDLVLFIGVAAGFVIGLCLSLVPKRSRPDTEKGFVTR